MSINETPKEESKQEPTFDAPSIVPAADTKAPEAVADSKSEKLPEAPTLAAAPSGEPKAEIASAPKVEPKIEPKAESKSEPKAERKPEPPVTRMPALHTAAKEKTFTAIPDSAAKKPSAISRFALLAACVAIAASFGAVGGSLAVAKIGSSFAPPQVTVAPVAKEHVAEEVKALKESVASLRAAMRTLSDSVGALKTTAAAATAQNSKIAEALERIEKSHTEVRKTAAAAPASDVTGSVQKQAAAPAVPMVLGSPPSTLKPLTVQGYVLRRVYDGAALIEGRDGMIEVEPGMVAPGLGRVESIKREDGRWVVVTARGIIR